MYEDRSDTERDPRRRWLVFTPLNGLILLTVAAIAVTVWSYHYFGKYRPFASILDQESNPAFAQIGMTVNDAQIQVRAGGKRKFRVSARRVSYSRDHRVIVLDGLSNGVLYDNHEQPRMKFDAGQVIYRTPVGEVSTAEGATVHLIGGVDATTYASGGTRISTDQIFWDSNQSYVEAPDSVNIVFPHRSGLATATDVVYYSRTRNLHVKHVHGTFAASKLVQ